MDDPTDLVRRGYDTVADAYLDWSARVRGDPRHALTDEFAGHLNDGARVLDLGCGAGVPTTKLLAERFEVVGVDVSSAQLARARSAVPSARFLQADLAALDLPSRSFDGVVALYSIPHVPRARHQRLLCDIAAWLRPGGVLLASLGAGDSGDWTGQWLGVDMFFSSFGAETNRELLRAAGLTLRYDRVLRMREPGGEAAFHWVIARRGGRDR